MGNCQAIDTATLVLQHPSGKSETMYWPVSANQIMQMHPGHYVALLITSSLYPSDSNHIPTNNNSTNNTSTNNSVRVTRIKLLKSTDTLLLGQVYRLITTQEVTKSLWAKKEAKLMKMKKKLESEIVDSGLVRRSDLQTLNQVTKHEQNKSKTTTTTIGRTKMWQPSLKSISEATQANN